MGRQRIDSDDESAHRDCVSWTSKDQGSGGSAAAETELASLKSFFCGASAAEDGVGTAPATVDLRHPEPQQKKRTKKRRSPAPARTPPADPVDVVPVEAAREGGHSAPEDGGEAAIAERYFELMTKGFYGRVQCRLLTGTAFTFGLVFDWLTAMGLICLQELALGCVWAVEWVEFEYQDSEHMETSFPMDFVSLVKADDDEDDKDNFGKVVLSNVPVFTIVPLVVTAILLSVGVMEEVREVALGTCVLRYVPSRRGAAAAATTTTSWAFAPRWAMAYVLVLSRLSLAVDFFQTASQLIGLADGPINIFMNSLSLLFIIEMDRAICHDLPGDQIYSTRAERVDHARGAAALRDVAAGLAEAAERMAPSTLGAHRLVYRVLEVGYAAAAFAVAREMQTKTSRGKITIADDGWSDEHAVADRVTAVFNWATLCIALILVAYVNVVATPHAAAPDATWASTAATFAAYFAADVGLLFFFFWVINLWVLDSLVIFGASATTIPFAALLSGTYAW